MVGRVVRITPARVDTSWKGLTVVGQSRIIENLRWWHLREHIVDAREAKDIVGVDTFSGWNYVGVDGLCVFRRWIENCA